MKSIPEGQLPVLLQTIDLLLFGIATNSVTSIEPSKLDELSLKLLCQEVFDIELDQIPKTSMAVVSFNALFLQDMGSEVAKYKNQLLAFRHQLQPAAELILRRTEDKLLCSYKSPRQSSTASFNIGSYPEIVLTALASSRVSVSREDLAKQADTSDSGKSIHDTINDIRKKFNISAKSLDNFIEATGNKYRITCKVTLE